MPNWVCTSWVVCLPKKNTKKFLNYFLGWRDDENNKRKKEFFYRTFITSESVEIDKDPEDSSLVSLRLISDTAWSLENLLIPHEDDDKKHRCIDLEEACLKCNVECLECDGDEPSMCFREFITYDKESGISYDTEDITPIICWRCNNMWYQEDYPEVAEGMCPFCKDKIQTEEE